MEGLTREYKGFIIRRTKRLGKYVYSVEGLLRDFESMADAKKFIDFWCE